MEVEAKRCGFLSDRRPIILFERHKFHQKTGGRFSQSHPEVSSKTAGGYGAGGAHQYSRLEQASRLDSEAAIWSTSWGLGQVMGFNATTAGFPDQRTMVQLMCSSEDHQFDAMIRFIISQGLDKPLRVANWSSFASGYNGVGYHINSYDERLRGAYQRFSLGPLPDIKARQAQLMLTFLGHDPGLIDGWFGPSSLRALNAFKLSRGRSEVSQLGNSDLEDLYEVTYN